MYTHAHTHTHARTRARAHTHTHTSVPTESLVHAQGLTVDSILEFRRCACLGPCIPHARIRARAALPARGAEEGGNMITMDMDVCRLCGSLVLIIDMRCDLHTLTQKRTARIQQRAQARICSSCLQRSGRPVPGWKAFTAAADRARSTEAEACGMAGNKVCAGGNLQNLIVPLRRGRQRTYIFRSFSDPPVLVPVGFRCRNQMIGNFK